MMVLVNMTLLYFNQVLTPMYAATVMWTSQSYLPALALSSDTGNILSVKDIHRNYIYIIHL